MSDAPTLLRVAIDFAIADDDDGQDAESAREAGPEAVPTSRFVERAGPTEYVMEEGVETVHQPPHFVMPPRLISGEPRETDATSCRIRYQRRRLSRRAMSYAGGPDLVTLTSHAEEQFAASTHPERDSHE